MTMRMKRFLALALSLMLLAGISMNSGSARAENYTAYSAYQACTYGMSSSQVIEWNSMMVNYNFPTYVLRNVITECRSRRGTPINMLGLVPTSGSNLRSYTSYGNNRNIIMKIHGNETVYVYYSLYDSNGGLWYYAVTKSGVEGYLAAVRIMLDYSWGVTYR